jgi:hypothetical protein
MQPAGLAGSLLSAGLLTACNVPIESFHRTDAAPGDIAPTDASLSALAQQAYLKASDAGAGDFFGSSVALSADGSTLAVGAFGEDSAATGIDGDQGDNSALDAGAVYVFTRSDATWRQQAYVKASNAGSLSEYFGYSIALSADGSTLAVGAFCEDSAAIGIDGNQADNSVTNAGAVYVFVRHGSSWSQQAYIKASNTGSPSDFFGHSVALSIDGSTLAVGASLEDSIANGIDGDQADNSATDAGAVYVFTRSGTTWSQQAYVKASNTGTGDHFGVRVTLSGNGSLMAVSADQEASAATSIDGNGNDNSAQNAGAVYVFARTGTMWNQQAYIKASNTGAGDQFGGFVALSADGSTLAVSADLEDSAATGVDGPQTDDSAPSAGAVYVFGRIGATWSQQAYVKASNTGVGDNFGIRVALSGDGSILVVGAYVEDSAAVGLGGNEADNLASNSGAAYVFMHNGTTWSQEAYVKASNTGVDDRFGSSVALSADGLILAVGAINEDSEASGIDGNQGNNSAAESGSVYVFAGIPKLQRSALTMSTGPGVATARGSF